MAKFVASYPHPVIWAILQPLLVGISDWRKSQVLSENVTLNFITGNPVFLIIGGSRTVIKELKVVTKIPPRVAKRFLKKFHKHQKLKIERVQNISRWLISDCFSLILAVFLSVEQKIFYPDVLGILITVNR
ncbi:hypothetical protein [uncultured Bartonella sp.]|uniref:hypothetical protein n=1 Tax=uncultured Bartonella sp. TaxID=104108 RepID=UPI00260AFADA|nr:hypothetical protein [uncultured Bartonella sp.]